MKQETRAVRKSGRDTAQQHNVSQQIGSDVTGVSEQPNTDCGECEGQGRATRRGGAGALTKITDR